MKEQSVKYTTDKGEIIGPLARIRDFLPSADELFTAAEKNGPQTKVTLHLDNDALTVFKREASRHKISYQQMIRNLVRSYALRKHRAKAGR